jgi:glucitol operon activator protein
MGFWSFLLLVLGILWFLQIVGTYYQMRHYRQVLGGITREGGEGYVGVGNATARLGKGVVLILVVGEDEVVGKALRMRGMTVFARFKEAPELVGLHIDDLRDEDRDRPYEKATMLAARRAVEQIDRIKAEREGMPV